MTLSGLASDEHAGASSQVRDQRTAMIASALAAVASFGLGVVLLVLVARDQSVNAGADLLASLVTEGSAWWVAARWLFLLVAGSGVGVVMAIRRFAPAGRRLLADWASAIGLCGFAVLAIDQVRLLSHTRAIATAAASRSGDTPDLVNASFLNLVDRTGILSLGAVGVWLALTSLLLLPTRTPNGLRAIGTLNAALLLVQPMLHGRYWAAAVGGASAALAAVFFGWYGLRITDRRPLLGRECGASDARPLPRQATTTSPQQD